MTENTSRPADDADADRRSSSDEGASRDLHAAASTGPTAVIETDAAADAFTTVPLVPPAAAEPAFFTTPADPAASADRPDSVYASASRAPASTTPPARPTVRWGALVWALIFGGTAALTLWILVDPARRLAADAWIAGLNPLAAWLSALIAVGVIVALFGVVGLIRRGERARRTPARS